MADATKSNSSPALNTSVGVGVITRPSRTIAAKDASSGSSISSTVLPIQLEESGKVHSTRLAWPFRNENKRTTSPTLTASSTKAEIILGVDTATSTPHDESNSHSFLG